MSCNPCTTNYPINTRTISISAESRGLVLEFSGFDFLGFDNLQKFNFKVCQCIPETSCPLQVYLYDGTNYVPVRTVSGNFLYSDQIAKRNVYYTVYGNDDVHFSLRCKVPNTSRQVVAVVSNAPQEETPVETISASKTSKSS